MTRELADRVGATPLAFGDFLEVGFGMATDPEDEPKQLQQHVPERSDYSKAEKVSISWDHQFAIALEVEAGAKIVPAKIDTKTAHEYAELYSIRSDLSFAQNCFLEANKIGMPDSESVISKALIFSAVIAYARPFASGVRTRLKADYFNALGKKFDLTLHGYLIAVRDKHVAHSVNGFEHCETTGVMVSSTTHGWQAAGTGVIQSHVIGISKAIVDAATTQITVMIEILTADIDAKRAVIFQAFRDEFTRINQWEMTPMIRFLDRTKVSKQRPARGKLPRKPKPRRPPKPKQTR